MEPDEAAQLADHVALGLLGVISSDLDRRAALPLSMRSHPAPMA